MNELYHENKEEYFMIKYSKTQLYDVYRKKNTSIIWEDIKHSNGQQAFCKQVGPKSPTNQLHIKCLNHHMINPIAA